MQSALVSSTTLIYRGHWFASDERLSANNGPLWTTGEHHHRGEKSDTHHGSQHSVLFLFFYQVEFASNMRASTIIKREH